MAGDRGAEATGPAAAPKGSVSAKASPSAGVSLTPATTAPRSSIDFAPKADGRSEAIASSIALREAPIFARRVSRADGVEGAAAGIVSVPNDSGSTGSISPRMDGAPAG